MNRVWIIAASPEREAQARVLMRSIERFSPDFIHLIDPTLGYPKKTITEQVVLTRLRLALKYLESGAKEVIVLGADNYFYSDPIELAAQYVDREALFIPHCQVWLPPPHDQNRSLIRAGVINSDLHVWRNTKRVRDFMRIIIHEIDHGPLFNVFEVEQWWLPYALSHLDAALIKAPGYGVAYYNLHEREIFPLIVRSTDGRQGPLRNMHYSGMTFGPKAKSLTEYPLPFSRSLNSTEKRLFGEYQREVEAEMILDGAAKSPQT